MKPWLGNDHVEEESLYEYELVKPKISKAASKAGIEVILVGGTHSNLFIKTTPLPALCLLKDIL